jgi:hypothetical protein
MEVVHPLVPIVELTRSSLPINMLPEELSEALGVSLSEVLARYYSESDISERGRLIGDTDNLNTTQTPECSKGKYNTKIRKQKSLLRSHQQPM